MLFDKIIEDASKEIDAANNATDLQKVKVKFLGRSGIISSMMKEILGLNFEDRKEFGKNINKVKSVIEGYISDRLILVNERELHERFESEKVDLTIPAARRYYGGIHPITQCIEEVTNILFKYGFKPRTGPILEDDWHNFTALNIDETHPARQMHDTFYLNDGKLLRTHTSPVQVRTMKNEKPPFRIISCGKVYRSDFDATHTPMFHQCEGLLLDKNITMAHLKYIITNFIRDFFDNSDIKVRFRPSFFPFTEPSAEVDICLKNSEKWLEVLGCGMVHPNVLNNVSIDSDQYQGFAFGFGIDRFAMLKYRVEDLRQFFESDVRWLYRYNFHAFDIPSVVNSFLGYVK